MYCSSCGAGVAQGLSYCNFCGAKLGGAAAEGGGGPAEVKPELIVSAMAGVFILGLVAIGILVGVLKEVAGLDLPFLLAAATFSFLMMFIIEGVFMLLLFRRRRGAGASAGESASLKGHATKELDAARARVLPEHMRAASVTEETTRTLEPAYRERTSK